MYQIVFVDDEFVIREGVSENIKWNELGYQLAAVCENGREAWKCLKNSGGCGDYGYLYAIYGRN